MMKWKFIYRPYDGDVKLLGTLLLEAESASFSSCYNLPSIYLYGN